MKLNIIKPDLSYYSYLYSVFVTKMPIKHKKVHAKTKGKVSTGSRTSENSQIAQSSKPFVWIGTFISIFLNRIRGGVVDRIELECLQSNSD